MVRTIFLNTVTSSAARSGVRHLAQADLGRFEKWFVRGRPACANRCHSGCARTAVVPVTLFCDHDCQHCSNSLAKPVLALPRAGGATYIELPFVNSICHSPLAEEPTLGRGFCRQHTCDDDPPSRYIAGSSRRGSSPVPIDGFCKLLRRNRSGASVQAVGLRKRMARARSFV